ncbi:MAG: DMT family transporter [Erysipelotrichaceae bacterium]|nr:DMT family transporter [Erysipelotrichaceae bacterium]
MKSSATLRYLFALTLYGTIGFFLHFISYSSEFVVLCRGLFGSLFILLVLKERRQEIDREAIRKNFKLLFISGAALGFNWVFLFAGYRYGIAISSLCNYMAPIIVVVISALVYKEKINLKQIICIIMALVGMLLLIGIFGNNEAINRRCVIYGSLAALGFVILVLCNRKLRDIDALEKTIIQLLSSMCIVLPYVILQRSLPDHFDLISTILVLVLGFLHTGVAYICYFSSIDVLSAQSIAILGYLEPVLNVVIGAIVFKERIGVSGIIGAVLIILASLGNEVFADKN